MKISVSIKEVYPIDVRRIQELIVEKLNTTEYKVTKVQYRNENEFEIDIEYN